MLEAAVPSPESVGGVRRSNLYRRIAKTALSLTFLGGFLILGGCSATPSASSVSTKSSICARNPPRLTPVTGSTLSTLPPSHDNDVGRMRLPDLHPDADVDANQVPKVSRCHKS